MPLPWLTFALAYVFWYILSLELGRKTITLPGFEVQTPYPLKKLIMDFKHQSYLFIITTRFLSCLRRLVPLISRFKSPSRWSFCSCAFERYASQDLAKTTALCLFLSSSVRVWLLSRLKEALCTAIQVKTNRVNYSYWDSFVHVKFHLLLELMKF